MSVTVKDLARHTNVSITTIPRVLNNRPDVKKETRDRVHNAIKKPSYSPNIVARGLVLKRSFVIGFIVLNITNPNLPELVRGIVNQAARYGYRVMLFDTNKDDEVEKEAIKLLQSKQVDGIILSLNDANKDKLKCLKEEHFPIVQIYRKNNRSVVSTIALDNTASAKRAVLYLIELGYTKIAHISTGENIQSGSKRIQGYRETLSEVGIPYDEKYVRVGLNTAESCKACIKQLLDLPLGQRPSAVYACHDCMAVGTYDAIFEAGLSITYDISVIGNDNNKFSRFIYPKLTTIDTFKQELGAQPVSLC